MTLHFSGKLIECDGVSMEMPWPVLQAKEGQDLIFVLLDPDSYLTNLEYKNERRDGGPEVRNLMAFDRTGKKIWDAEFPEQSDYYYSLNSVDPLIANSFSSYRCEIDLRSGAIIRKAFFK